MSREDTAAPSHSSTTQWQSFEMRMRQRRADRCVQRAELALEAGNEEAAREAIEEARVLDPSAPEFESLRAVVAERQQVTLDAGARSGRRLVMAASLLLVTAVGVGAAVWQRVNSPLAPVAVATTGETTSSTQAAAAPVQPQNAQLALVTAKSGAVESTVPTSAPGQQPVSTPELSPAVLTVPVVGREVEIAVPSVPASDKSTLDLGTPVPDLPMPPLPEVAPPPKAASRAADPSPTVDESPRVRAALAQYESAYSTLDVSAAQSIWPAVDARALARAFEGLESQRVSLGNCSVTVDGASARADCSGTASWTPKIGGGTQSGSRHWRFELKKVDGAWQIVRADMR
jgi:hypothetical protein